MKKLLLFLMIVFLAVNCSTRKNEQSREETITLTVRELMIVYKHGYLSGGLCYGIYESPEQQEIKWQIDSAYVMETLKSDFK